MLCDVLDGSGARASGAIRREPGTGALHVGRFGSTSVVTRAYATSPLKLLTPGNHGHAAWVYTATYGGGLVDGDSLHLSIDVEQGAAVLVSTQASTKVYRSPRGTTAGLDAAVDEDALLIVAPDPVVGFAGSRYTQTQRFTVAPTAGLIVVDWMTSGRRATGERWAFESYDSRTTIHCEGRLVLHDALSLSSDDGSVAARMERFDVVCAIVLFGERLREAVDRCLQSAAAGPPMPRSDLLVAVAPLPESGCLVRIAGVSLERVARTVRDHLRFVPALVGDDPWARKW